MDLRVKIDKGLMLFTIFAQSSIFEVWYGSKCFLIQIAIKS